MPKRILLIGGTDHDLRIPFFLALRDRGFQPVIASSGHSWPFEKAGLDHHFFSFDRFVSPFSDYRAISVSPQAHGRGAAGRYSGF